MKLVNLLLLIAVLCTITLFSVDQTQALEEFCVH